MTQNILKMDDVGAKSDYLKYSVSLRGVAETALIPLYARAVDSRSLNSALGDTFASKLVEQLDYDFSRLPLSPSQVASIVLRTRYFDDITQSFLDSHNSSTILHIGCGLDARASRCIWGQNVCWVDIDFQEIVTLRKLLSPVLHSSRDYRLVAANINETGSWLENIPADRPTAIVMEGFVSYLSVEERDGLLSRLVEHFDEAEIVFDCINPQLLALGERAHAQALRNTGAEFQSAISDPRALENIHERLQHVKTDRFVELSVLKTLPWMTRFQLYVLSWIPGWKDFARYVHFKILPRSVD